MRWTMVLMFGAWSLAGCDRDDKKDGTDSSSEGSSEGGSSGTTAEPQCMVDADCADGQTCQAGQCMSSFWAVGGGGTIVRVDAAGGVEPRPALAGDLAAIECEGSTRAWVVGEGGLVAHTNDGGDTWAPIVAPTVEDLEDVTLTEDGTVVVVGRSGVWLAASDGLTFEPWTGASADLRGVAAGAPGILAVAADGSVWRGDPSSATVSLVAELDPGLRAIAAAHEVPSAVAVGDGGALSWSVDGGATWTRHELGIEAELHAVAMSHDGSTAVAVGAGGIVVRIADEAATTQLVGAADLHDIHLDADGHGAAVGDGIVLTTADAGLTFTALPTLAAELFGVDALGREHW